MPNLLIKFSKVWFRSIFAILAESTSDKLVKKLSSIDGRPTGRYWHEHARPQFGGAGDTSIARRLSALKPLKYLQLQYLNI